MLLAKRFLRLVVIFLVGSVIGVACFHFFSSLFVLNTTTTDLVLLKAVRIPVNPPEVIALRVNRERSDLDTRKKLADFNYNMPEPLSLYTTSGGNTSVEQDVKMEAPIHGEAEGLTPERRTLNKDVLDHVEDKSRHVVSGPVMTVEMWNNMSVSERAKYQQQQANNFCKHHGVNTRKPGGKIGRHLLTNNKTKTAFCFAPKVGCTNLKILFFLAQGALPSHELYKSRDNVDQEILEKAISKLSFKMLSSERQKHVLQNYYKFVMYRNPVERLVSAYRSKVQRYPLLGLEPEHPHYNWLRMRIYGYKHPKLFRNWQASKGKESISISFMDFIDYWLHKGGLGFDEHFQPIFGLCKPCYVKYSYYGNFNTFDKDAEVLIEHMGSNGSLLRQGYYSEGEMTSDLAPKYYRLLSHRQKELIIHRLALDLSFYYSIFPAERDSHKTIMATDLDVLLL